MMRQKSTAAYSVLPNGDLRRITTKPDGGQLELGIESGTRAGEEKAHSARRIRGHRNGPMPRLTVEQ